MSPRALGLAMLLACALARGGELRAQDGSLEAAAKLTGLTSGMAAACRLDSKPVLRAFRALLDRQQVQGARRRRLVQLVSASSDRGYATQHEPGAMSCTDVAGEIRKAVRRLQKAR
jgi:hypothetical protein